MVRDQNEGDLSREEARITVEGGIEMAPREARKGDLIVCLP
jgi:hypothetical protein